MNYSAKLLLFGEHIVIQGAEALAMPFPAFQGNWAYTWPEELKPAQQLFPFFQYLHKDSFFEQWIDFPALKGALEKGLYFQSDIPVGYGVGSSGAVCAAVLDTFKKEPLPLDQPQLLRTILAKMEGYFHGESSGTDPLICLLNQAVKLHGKKTIELVTLPKFSQLSPLHFFLIDTGITRSTNPLVQYFREQYKNPSFAKKVDEQLIPTSNRAIELLLSAEGTLLGEMMAQISTFQFQFLKEMIPTAFIPIWEQGLNAQRYYLKLCGAGGGGFLLGGTMDKPKTIEALESQQIKLTFL